MNRQQLKRIMESRTGLKHIIVRSAGGYDIFEDVAEWEKKYPGEIYHFENKKDKPSIPTQLK